MFIAFDDFIRHLDGCLLTCIHAQVHDGERQQRGVDLFGGSNFSSLHSYQRRINLLCFWPRSRCQRFSRGSSAALTCLSGVRVIQWLGPHGCFRWESPSNWSGMVSHLDPSRIHPQPYRRWHMQHVVLRPQYCWCSGNWFVWASSVREGLG